MDDLIAIGAIFVTLKLVKTVNLLEKLAFEQRDRIHTASKVTRSYVSAI